MQRKPPLPKGWRLQVVDMLKQEGINIHPQTITNILAGKSRHSLELATKIEACRQKIVRRQLLAAARLKKLRKAA